MNNNSNLHKRKGLSPDQMKNLSIDEIINLYKIGFRLNETILDNYTIENNYVEIRNLADQTIDPFVNFGKVTVSTGYSDIDTSIILSSGNGSILPDPLTDGPFNLVWWNSTDYSDPTDDPNKEIVRVTAKSGDTLTIKRGQENTIPSIKNIAGKTYRMVNALTSKTITDLQNIPAKSLQTSSGILDITSTTPIAGQILTAISPTSATWQSLAAPQCFFVALLASPSFGTFPLTVNYNATVLGGTAPYTYSWIFGDGYTSTLPNPSHTFTVNGTFTTRLTVIDSDGNSATSATTITVTTAIAVVTTGLAFSESIAVPDYLTGFYNAGPLVLDSITYPTMSDILTGFYNASANQASPFQDSITYPTMSDLLVGIFNSSANMASPFQDYIPQSESISMLSSITIPGSISLGKNSSTTLTPTCYLYGTLTGCPLLSWSSSNSGIATVSSFGVVTTGNNAGTANITTYSSGIQSNACTVTVS